MSSVHIVSVILAGAIAFGSAFPVQAASPEENKAQLLKTRSCPGCNLAGVNLNRAELAGADLQGADLSDAKLMLANLAGANLQKANLKGVKFGGADLANADLRGAAIDASALNGAYYKGASIDATVAEALNVEVSDTGLESVEPAETDAAVSQTVEQQTPGEQPDAAEAKEPPVAVESPQDPAAAPVAQEAAEPTHQDFAAGEQSPVSESVPVVPEEEAGNASMQQAAVVEEQPPAAATAATDDGPGQPAERDLSTGDAPAVKTVQPMGTIVIAEPAPVQEITEAFGPEQAEETAAESQRGEGLAEPAVQSEPQAENAGEAAAVEPAPALVAENAQANTAAAGQSALPADAAKTERLARLIKTKRCYGCDLSGLDLSDMRLKRADLEGADLSGCNLEGAVLDAANLKGAVLRQANLKKASMKAADLYRADLTAADLTDAKMDKALIDDAVFTDVIGLSEEIRSKLK